MDQLEHFFPFRMLHGTLPQCAQLPGQLFQGTHLEFEEHIILFKKGS